MQGSDWVVGCSQSFRNPGLFSGILESPTASGPGGRKRESWRVQEKFKGEAGHGHHSFPSTGQNAVLGPPLMAQWRMKSGRARGPVRAGRLQCVSGVVPRREAERHVRLGEAESQGQDVRGWEDRARLADLVLEAIEGSDGSRLMDSPKVALVVSCNRGPPSQVAGVLELHASSSPQLSQRSETVATSSHALDPASSPEDSALSLPIFPATPEAEPLRARPESSPRFLRDARSTPQASPRRAGPSQPPYKLLP